MCDKPETKAVACSSFAQVTTSQQSKVQTATIGSELALSSFYKPESDTEGIINQSAENFTALVAELSPVADVSKRKYSK